MSGKSNSDLKLELFEDFIEERLGCTLIYHPDKKGFVYFRVLNDSLVIQELYVPVKYRGQNVAGWLLESVRSYALKFNLKAIMASVVFNTPTAEQALAFLIHKGYKVGEMGSGRIVMVKEV